MKYTDFTNAIGERFMRVIGPDTDNWFIMLPAWYECWPARLAQFIKANFTAPKS